MPVPVCVFFFCSFCVQNACFEHPPNKCDFVQCGGLRTALDVMDRDQPRSIMVVKQGLSLLAYVLRDDPQVRPYLALASIQPLSSPYLAPVLPLPSPYLAPI